MYTGSSSQWGKKKVDLWFNLLQKQKHRGGDRLYELVDIITLTNFGPGLPPLPIRELRELHAFKR